MKRKQETERDEKRKRSELVKGLEKMERKRWTEGKVEKRWEKRLYSSLRRGKGEKRKGEGTDEWVKR